MSISLFLTFRDPAAERRVQADDLVTAAGMVRSIPGLIEGLLFTPLERNVAHPFAKDGPPPLFALQLRFADLFTCEAAAVRGGVCFRRPPACRNAMGVTAAMAAVILNCC